jgi:iron complex outermembrane receptor protein
MLMQMNELLLRYQPGDRPAVFLPMKRRAPMGMRKHIALLFFLFSTTAIGGDHIIPSVVLRTKKPSSASSGASFLIAREQLLSTSTLSLGQALQSFAGVQVQDLSGNNNQVLLGMRGFGANASSNTLILINGIPLTNPDIAAPDLNAIPLYAIEYVEIMAGSESVLYGDQAVGGAINIVTHESITPAFNVNCDAGSYHFQQCYFNLNQTISRWQLDLTGAASRTDNYREHNHYDQAYLTSKLFYDSNLSKWYVYLNADKENLQFPGALNLTQAHQNRRQATNSTDFFNDWSGFFHLKNSYFFNTDWKLETDLSRRDMHGNGVLFSPFTQSRQTYFIKPQLKGKVRNINMIIGSDIQQDNYSLSTVFTPTRDKQEKYSLFFLASKDLTSNLTLSAGARGALQSARFFSSDLENTINRAFAATLGMTYQALPTLRIYLRRAGSFRFPKADENSQTAQGAGPLRTQRGIAYETGTTWENHYFNADFNVYQLQLKDEIAFDPFQTPTTPFGSNQNLAPTVRQGFSLTLRKSITEKLTVSTQYHFVSARFQHGIYQGNRIPLVSENIINANMNYQWTDAFNLYAEGIFTGNQFAANDYANVTGAQGGYTVYNIAMHCVFKHMTASFRVNNIFNQYYYFYTVFQPGFGEFFYPAPGINFSLSIRYDFW